MHDAEAITPSHPVHVGLFVRHEFKVRLLSLWAVRLVRVAIVKRVPPHVQVKEGGELDK